MVKVETFCDHPNNANTYLIKKDGHGIIIDPANNLKTLQRFCDGVIIDAIFLTHGHYDHFKNLEAIMKHFDVKCYMHKDAKKKIFDINSSYAYAFGCNIVPNINQEELILIQKEQKIIIGSFEVEVVFTPGHTNCSVIYIIDNYMFSGDTLFKNSVGRTDLATGNPIVLNNTLDKIRKIKQNYEVYPGHEDNTTLFDEIKYNPYLR